MQHICSFLSRLTSAGLKVPKMRVHLGFGKLNRNLRSTSSIFVISRQPLLPENIERRGGISDKTVISKQPVCLSRSPRNLQDVAHRLRSRSPGNICSLILDCWVSKGSGTTNVARMCCLQQIL